MITALRNGKYVTRNASLFRKVNISFSEREEESDEDEDDYGTEHDANGQNKQHLTSTEQNDS